VGTTIFITFGTNGSAPSPSPTTSAKNPAHHPQSLSALSGDRFTKTAWTERMDAE